MSNDVLYPGYSKYFKSWSSRRWYNVVWMHEQRQNVEALRVIDGKRLPLYKYTCYFFQHLQQPDLLPDRIYLRILDTVYAIYGSSKWRLFGFSVLFKFTRYLYFIYDQWYKILSWIPNNLFRYHVSWRWSYQDESFLDVCWYHIRPTQSESIRFLE